jgi:hypothetical protein
MMPDAKRKKGGGHGQEEAQEAAQVTHEVLSGVTVVQSDGLNSYERARLCDQLARTFKDVGIRGTITVRLDGKVLR